MIEWIRQLLDLDQTPSSETTEDDPFDGIKSVSLYEIGEHMCSHYPDGLPGMSEQSRQWGEYSMDVVLREWLGDTDPTVDHLRQLDSLLEAATDRGTTFEQCMQSHRRPNQILQRSKVEEFRRIYANQFTPAQLSCVIADYYWEIRDDIFALDVLFDEQTTDRHTYSFVVDEPDRQPVRMSGESVGMQVTSFNQRTIEMMTIACRIDLAETVLHERLRETIEHTADLCWDALDVSGGTSIEHGEQFVNDIIRSVDEIEGHYGRTDTVIVNGDEDITYPADELMELTIIEDETGVMDVPFIVADTSELGYRVIREPPAVKSALNEDMDYSSPHEYRYQWAGNYALTNEQMVAGPVDE